MRQETACAKHPSCDVYQSGQGEGGVNFLVNSPPSKSESRLLAWATFFTLVLGCAWALALNLVDSDLWGHIRYAEDWLAAGQLPQTASHTFSEPEHSWINHENLAELAFATGYRTLGIYGLLAAKCLLGLGMLAAMASYAQRRGVGWLTTWVFMLLVASNLHPFFLLRPQLLSFGLCAVVLVLLERAFCEWHDFQRITWHPLWLLPWVFALWANTHGAFAAGLGIVGAYLLGRIVELGIDPRIRLRDRLHLLLVGLGCFVATLANPYGIELHRWLARSLSRPRPEITEWAAPNIENIVFWPWVLLLTVTLLGLLATRQRRDWVKLVIMALVAWQSARHMRHIAFFALVCGFWLPVYLPSAIARLRFKIAIRPWFRRTVFVGLLLGISGLSFAIDRQLSSFPVARNAYPLDAVQFMVDRGLHEGKLVVAFNWAQYAIAALAPEMQVAFDGRFRTCYPQEIVDMHFDFLLGEFGGRRYRSPKLGPMDGARVLKHGSPDLVLLDRRYEHSVAVMQEEASQENPEWVLLFRDRIAEIWGRRTRYDDPLGPHFFPVALRVQDPRPRDGAVEWPALPLRDTGLGLEQHAFDNLAERGNWRGDANIR